MLKNPIAKNILSAIAVAGFGYVLLTLLFILYALLAQFVLLFLPANFVMTSRWFMPTFHALFMTIIGAISWFIFRSNLGVLYKAIFMTAPLSVVFVTLGMFLGRWPVISYLLGVLFGVGVLYYLYRTKQPWLYYYTLILVGLVFAIMSILRVEI